MKSYINHLSVPTNCILAADDNALSKKRKELAERLKQGQTVSVTPSGTLVTPNSPEAQQQGGKTLNVPDGKLAVKSAYEFSELDEMESLLEIEALTVELLANRLFRLQNRASDRSLTQKRLELAARLRQGEAVKINTDGAIGTEQYSFATHLSEQAQQLSGLSGMEKIVILRKLQKEIDEAVDALHLEPDTPQAVEPPINADVDENSNTEAANSEVKDSVIGTDDDSNTTESKK